MSANVVGVIEAIVHRNTDFRFRQMIIYTGASTTGFSAEVEYGAIVKYISTDLLCFGFFAVLN